MSRLAKSRGKQLDRSNSFVASRGRNSSVEHRNAIVIVDPFSTGAHLAAEVCRNDLICCRVFSVWDSPIAALVQKGLNIDFKVAIY